MLSRVGVVFASLAFLVTVVIGAQAQFGVPLNRTEPKMDSATAREVVARYCRMDYAGARLDPSQWPKVQPLVSWRTNPEFPLLMVTLRFDVDSDPIQEHDRYLVRVHYRLLGRYDMSEGYSNESANTVQDVQFAVAEVNGEWRITDAEPNYPHVSRAAALKWLNKKLAETQDPASKMIYQQAVDALQPPKPTAAAQ